MIYNIVIIIYLGFIVYIVYRHYSLEYKYNRFKISTKKQILILFVFLLLISIYTFWNI
jgi:hypothetical protein